MGWEERARFQGGSELARGLSSVGGSQNLRFYWKEFVSEVDVLVFMVDSADRPRLPWARQELHKLLDKDPDLPVVVVANKQVSRSGLREAGSGALGRDRPSPRPGAPGGVPVPHLCLCSFLTLSPHPVRLPLCLPVICHPGEMGKISIHKTQVWF